jgi:MFS family permease
MDSSGGGRAALIPNLGPRAWAIVGGGAVASTSYGFVAAFLMLYLHYARGMSLGTAGMALAVVAVGGLLVSPVVGWATDRFGARLVLVVASAVAAAGVASLALVHSPLQAMGATLLFGLGSVAITAPESTLLATAVPKERRSAAYALQYTGMSVGWSVGALLGGWFVDLSRPETFGVAFAIAALPFLAYAGVIACLSKRSPYEEGEVDDSVATGEGAVPVYPAMIEDAARPLYPPVATPGAEGARPAEKGGDAGGADARRRSGYRLVLRDRVFLQILGYFFLVITFAGVQLDATFPPYAVGVGGVSTRVIGLAFAANTIVIVASQLFVLRSLVGRRRTRALVVSSLFGCLCWLIVLAAGHAGGDTLASLGFVLAMMTFALAEATWSPCLAPMVNDIAPSRLRGRYNALLGTVDSAGRIVGPIFAGFLLGAGLGDALVALLAAVTACGALLALRLERRVPESANRVGAASGPTASESLA